VRWWFSRWMNWQVAASPRSAEAYLTATVLIVIASLARWGLGFLGTPLLPFTTYYPVMLFATYFGGLQVGIYAVIVGGLVGLWAFIPPYFTFSYTPTRAFEVLAYLFASVLLMWGAASYRKLTDRYRNTADRLQDEEKLRRLAVDELAHRLKNKIATIQSIISFQLRDQPRLRDDIIARLIALSATDDLIMATQGQGARIHDILSTELGAYEVSRVSLKGPDVFLSAKLAMTMALLVHELATNAAKYGALSSPAGKLFIRWDLSSRILDLNWCESGGPIVASPSHQGFGLQLISRALDQFNGTAQTTFKSSGLICKIKVDLMENTQAAVLDAGRACFAEQ